ncbi:hypothetical protein PC116_g29511 [Phytophthora cactorum]|nr:hypothetical protein PC116_g29511 [Phytophthora cactorum]
MDSAISLTSAPVFSHIAEIELMLLMRCASMEFATSFANSDEYTLVLMMRDRGTHVS